MQFKKYLFLLFGILIFNGFQSFAQITGVKVEKYYIADANDATDTTGGRSLDVGSITYRVYVELLPGSKLKKIYGDSYHPLIINSTANFYNNIDRPGSVFGYQVKSSWFSDNPTLALDSWLTLGLATSTQKGILKNLDNDGDAITGLNNNGGTALIASGLLLNNDTSAGTPLSIADGLVTNINSFGQWVDIGFKDFSGSDTTTFGASKISNEFSCTSCALQQNTSVAGPQLDSTRVLVAQLTTSGELTFRLNVTVEQMDSLGNIVLVNYVANNDTLLADEQVSPWLKFPPVCGCTDTRYLEYSAGNACTNNDSCKTLIVFGCTDTLACNYDPSANVNIHTLCCYPGLCSDRDLSLACPELASGRFAKSNVVVYPNPTADQLTVEVYSKTKENVSYSVHDPLGREVLRGVLSLDDLITKRTIDLSKISGGIYFFQLYSGDKIETIKILKL